MSMRKFAGEVRVAMMHLIFQDPERTTQTWELEYHETTFKCERVTVDGRKTFKYTAKAEGVVVYEGDSLAQLHRTIRENPVLRDASTPERLAVYKAGKEVEASLLRLLPGEWRPIKNGVHFFNPERRADGSEHSDLRWIAHIGVYNPADNTVGPSFATLVLRGTAGVYTVAVDPSYRKVCETVGEALIELGEAAQRV